MKSLSKWLKRIAKTLLLLGVMFAVYGGLFYGDSDPLQVNSRLNEGLYKVKLADANIAYRVAGLDHDSKTPVVMIHSMFFHMGMWDAWSAGVSKSRPVYRFDVAGHGLSSTASSDDYSLAKTVETLQLFLDHHELDKVVLVGSSMGAATALNFAVENPDRVEKLVLVNAGGLEGHDDADSAGAPAWIYWILRYLPDWALDSFVNWAAADNDTGDQFRSDFKLIFRGDGTREGILGRMQDFKSPTTREILPLLTMPVLIQWGAVNPQLPLEQADKFKALIEQGGAPVSFRVYNMGGHLLPAEPIPDAVDHLVEFLDD